MLPALFLLAACTDGDTTAPDSSTAQPVTSAAVSINPRNVTVETNQLIRFLATGTNSTGARTTSAVVWTATGGTILSDGRFSSAVPGRFLVVGRPVKRQLRVDTAIVDVVRRNPGLESISVGPDSATLKPGATQAFLVTGYAKGREVPVGVNWSATGGTIDAGGNYVAGDSGGTFQVIATDTRLTISDTATVVIDAPVPEPPPVEPPAPVLEKVTLMPLSATLAPKATRQFAAFGRLQSGDSVAVDVVFTATGGTVTPGGLFTAGSTAGTFRVIATSDSLADTSAVTVTVPLGSGPTTGIPFGPYKLWIGPSSYQTAGAGSFTASIDYTDAALIIRRINTARSVGKRLMLMMTDDGHDPYITNGLFDMVKWKAAMDTYRDPAIQKAVADGVADGTILGNSVLDEPNHRSWGGVLNKAKLDQMCSYVKEIFPTLPVGVVVVHWWKPFERFNTCDFIVDQWDWWQSPNGPGGGDSGNILGWRDAALAMAASNGIAIVFSLNNLDGGIQDITEPREWTCPLTTTGGRGTYSNACRMTAAQIRTWGTILGSSGCALTMWRYDSVYMTDPANMQAFKDVATALANLPAKSCRRPR
jgi:hypothetical protein